MIFYSVNNWVFSRRVGDSVYIEDCKNQRIIVLEDTAADIWSCIDNGFSFNQTLDYIAKLYDVDVQMVSDDCHEFIDSLYHIDIISIEGKENISTDKVNSNIKVIRHQVGNDQYTDGDIGSTLYDSFADKHYLHNASLELTYLCNERCVHCYATNQNGYDPKKELSTEQWKDIIDQLFDMNTQNLIMTGGEIFCRPDFMEIFRYAIKKRFVVTLFTNGQAISDENIEEIAASYPKAVHVSIFSADPFIHDSITQIPGSHAQAVRTLRKFSELGTPISIKCQLMKMNKDDLEPILDLAEELGSDYQIGLTISPKNDGNKEPLEYGITDSAMLKNILKNERFPYINTELISDAKRDPYSMACGAGLYNLVIDPVGNYKACIAMPEVLDKYPTNIADVWNHNKRLQEIVSIRWKDIEGCNTCDYSSYCYFCMGLSYMEHGTYLQKNSINCRVAKSAYEVNAR